MDHLRLAWQAGETLLNHVPFEEDPKGTRYNILLAVQELLTNVFRHGYAAAETPMVELRFEFREAGFEFVIRDRARQFDPTVPGDPRRIDDFDGGVGDGADDAGGADDDPASMIEGGYGLMIVKAVMDELEYVHEDGWNVLRAFKSVRSRVASGASNA
jgi:anti-sigma regulatory factor (Ser/Thr protein kinase)